MARVHSSSSSSSPAAAAMAASGQGRREVFTVWMKSLVLNGRGCTVYDSGGRIVYRVDNYGSRSCHDVCLMDLHGGIVLNILKKKLAFGKWEGYKWSSDRKKPAWFTVARPPLFRRSSSSSSSSSSSPSSSSCEFESEAGCAVRYKINGGEKRACCRIEDEATGAVVAEVKRKVTAGGVALGEDVLALVVEPGVDHSLIMGLVLVYGLMNRTM